MDTERANRACRNILSRIGCSEHDDVLIIFDREKQELSQIMASWVQGAGANPYMFAVPAPTRREFASWFVKLLSEVVKTEPTVVLLSHSIYTPKGIMDVIGRPRMDWESSPLPERFFCDWAMPVDSFVRLYSADPVGVERYRQALLREIGGGRSIRVRTDLGTDVIVQARSWCDVADGEVFAVLVEDSGTGVVVFDSSMYSGRLQHPIKVTHENGRIRDIECLGVAGRQYEMFLADSKKDDAASVVVELGIGINPNADPYGHVMEAEQARGTCHFGFGDNVPFGGCNRSSIHYDAVVRRPTIYVEGRTIMAEGELVSWEENQLVEER